MRKLPRLDGIELGFWLLGALAGLVLLVASQVGVQTTVKMITPTTTTSTTTSTTSTTLKRVRQYAKPRRHVPAPAPESHNPFKRLWDGFTDLF